MHDTIAIPVPFDLTQAELVLDPVSINADISRGMHFLVDDVSWDDTDELERIMRSTIVLYHFQHRIAKTNATFAECLDTAIVWERG